MYQWNFAVDEPPPPRRSFLSDKRETIIARFAAGETLHALGTEYVVSI